MNETIKNAKIKTANEQIGKLRAERDRVAADWLTRGMEKTQEVCDVIGEQIVALYEEIDALEAGETTQAGRSENVVGRDDEIGVTPGELRAVSHLGWGREEVIKAKRKARRTAR